MTRTVFVNGEYCDESDATISIFDRGFLFADAVYEVTAVIGGGLVDWGHHLKRLKRSLKELQIEISVSDEELFLIHKKLIDSNQLMEGLIYLQISRGVADRDFFFPKPEVQSSLVLFTQKKSIINNPSVKNGIKIISLPDNRWGRCDIKTVQLLAASMNKMSALSLGKDDAWMVKGGFVTEGTSNNAYIITKNNTLVTRKKSTSILAGVTRQVLLELTNHLEIKVEERPFSIEEVKIAKEAFSSSATSLLVPVVEIDSCSIGDGKPGKMTKLLREKYLMKVQKSLL